MDRRGSGGSGDGAEYAIQREIEDVAAVVEVDQVQIALLAAGRRRIFSQYRYTATSRRFQRASL